MLELVCKEQLCGYLGRAKARGRKGMGGWVQGGGEVGGCRGLGGGAPRPESGQGEDAASDPLYNRRGKGQVLMVFT